MSFVNYLILGILKYEFYDFEKIHTPVNVDVYANLLNDFSYDEAESRYLINGLKNGFSIEYNGPRNRSIKANNLKLRVVLIKSSALEQGHERSEREKDCGPL